MACVSSSGECGNDCVTRGVHMVYFLYFISDAAKSKSVYVVDERVRTKGMPRDYILAVKWSSLSNKDNGCPGVSGRM